MSEHPHHDLIRAEVQALFVPSGARSVGVEAEFFTRTADGSRPPYDTLKALAATPLPNGGQMSVEPGSQIEVASRPHADSDAAVAALLDDIAAMVVLCADQAIEVVGGAIDTSRAPERTCAEARYIDLEREVDAYSGAGRWMMNNTCALQVNVGVGAPMADAWRAMNVAAPLLTAAFANSPGSDDAGRSWKSLRQGCWASMDPRRAGAPPAAGVTGVTGVTGDVSASYLAYALAAPVLGGAGLDTPERIRQHLSTLFPPVRPRRWLEVRCIDMVDGLAMRAAVAAVAALGDPDVVRDVLAMGSHGVSFAGAASAGLHAPGAGEAAIRLFDILIAHEARGGASASAGNERPMQHFVDDYVAHQRCPADDPAPRAPQLVCPPLTDPLLEVEG